MTYSKQVSRILQSHCVACHRPGEIAPFSLTVYRQAAGWSSMIAEVVDEGRMPPWHASPEHGKFTNDARLSNDEKKMIRDWVAAGSPEGEPAACRPHQNSSKGGRFPGPTSCWRCPARSRSRPRDECLTS